MSMTAMEYERAMTILPASGGFDVWDGGEFIGHRKTENGARGLVRAEAARLVSEAKAEAEECRSLARSWFGRVGHFAEA